MPWRAPSSWPSSPRYLSASRLANWVVNQYEFDSPDTVADLHAAVFMGCNVGALLIGWLIGWIVGGRLVRHAPVA